MKRILTLIAAILTISASAQLTANDIGLPENLFNELQYVVFDKQFEQASLRAPGAQAIELTKLETRRTSGGVTTTTKEVVIRESKYRAPGIRNNVGVYALNLASNFYHEFGYKQVAETDSGFVMTDPKDGWRLVIWNKSGAWYSQQLPPDYGFRLTDPYTKISRMYSEAELMQMKYFARGARTPRNLTRADLISFHQNYRIGSERNPATHVCSFFSTISQLDADTYKARIYINGKDITTFNYSGLITSFNTTGFPIGSIKWKMLNACVPGDGGTINSTNPFSGSFYEYGNAGTCAIGSGSLTEAGMTIDIEAGSSFSYTHTEPNICIYNDAKPFMLWFVAESQGANGKNEATDCYFYVSQNRRVFSLFGNN